ncbi:PTS transporter subunit IIC [Oceanivirga salmonicida]|uniref:PTS transporter subunit IIC n=1 Tax=Oceanivirga salmonicida TaxID=1769291 RepID=UPI0008349C2A|nr:PTS transporter subunit IIC [Oceanivirga salmonicida]
MDYILNLFLKQIFGQPFILMGIIVLIGYLATGEKLSKSLVGAFKASIGILILGIGAGGLISRFNTIINVTKIATKLQGAGLNTYPTMINGYNKMDAILGSGTGATWGIYTLLLTFLLNIIFVIFRKYTKIKSIFLTGNVMLVQAGISTYIVWRFLGLNMIPTIIIASIITAIYQGVGSTLLIKPTNEVTGADFTVAHQQMFISYLASKFSHLFGNPEKDNIENKKLPESLNVFQDNVIATLIIMFISVGTLFIIMGNDGIQALREALNQKTLTNTFTFLTWISVILTADIYILLAGVRMFVGEIMVSFKGISDKILPGAVAGVDCAAIFAFSPKAVLLGFLFGTIGQILGLGFLIIFSFPIFIIPGFIPLFFDNATIAIFANKYGGYKAAIVFCLITGVLQIVGSAFIIEVMDMQWWQGSADYVSIWWLIINIFKFIGSFLGLPIAG